MGNLSDFEGGLILGLLIGEVHFGGDRKQPHATLKMHINQKALFDWLQRRLPLAKVYGPYTYTHGDGIERTFYQMMFRGKALTEELVPILESYDWRHISPHVYFRYERMKNRYPRQFGLLEPSD